MNSSATPRPAAIPSGTGVWATRPLADRSKLDGGRNFKKTMTAAVSDSTPAAAEEAEGIEPGLDDNSQHHTLATLPPLPSLFDLWNKPEEEGYTLRTLPVSPLDYKTRLFFSLAGEGRGSETISSQTPQSTVST